MTTYDTITAEDVFSRIQDLAKDNPDFVYQDQEIPGSLLEDRESGIGCSYLGAHISMPGIGRPCIVGQALQDLGVPQEDLKNYEDYSAHRTMRGLGISGGLDTFVTIDNIQEKQDQGTSWGVAVYGHTNTDTNTDTQTNTVEDNK